MTTNLRRIYLAAWLGLAWLLVAAPSGKAAVFSTIVTNGPATNRLNLVFFSEGYTNGQLGQFLVDTTNAANAFFSVQPYAEYASYFNVFAVFTNSAHAGSTHLTYYPFVRNYTCFNSTYESPGDYLITIPPNTADSNSGDGQGKITSLLQLYLPSTNNDLPALLINDPVEGGSDGGSSDYGKTAISSIAAVSYILVHESGHTLGNLGDEYSTAYPGYSTNDVEPNTTTNTIYSKIKWNAWISTNTPIPTPSDGTYPDSIGLFQGAHYHTNNWYRPYYDCCMRSFGYAGFCPVCQETLVVAIYGKTRPVEARSPVTNSLTVSSPQMLTFTLNLLQPATHSLNIKWRTNAIAVSGATNSVFGILPQQLGNGSNKVDAVVWDATGMVRKDTRNLLKQTNAWTLNLAVPTLVIDSVKWSNNGSLTFRVTGTAPGAVAIQASTNLIQWTSLATNAFSGGAWIYTDAENPVKSKRFYRAKTPP